MPRTMRAFRGYVLPSCLVVLGLSAAVVGAADSPRGPALLAPVLDWPEETAHQQLARAEEAEKQAAGAGKAEKPAATDAKRDAQTPPAGEKPDAAEPAEPKPELSPEMAALRDRVRRTLARAARQPLNTRDHSATDIIEACLAFGCDGQVRLGGPSGEKINSVTCLCWNYPCAGRELLTVADGHIAARVGYGLQTRRSQFLAVLAQARVPEDYPIRVGEDVRKVSDLVEYEKLHCRAGVDSSLKLVGLAFYADEPTWKDNLGQTWSLERLVDEELDRKTAMAPEPVTDRLTGLTCAVQRQLKGKQPLTGAFERARQYLAEFQDFTLKQQNSDGSWHPDFPASVGASRDTTGVLLASGHILGWLALVLPDDRLEDPHMVSAVARVNALLEGYRSLGSGVAMSPREMAAVMHAIGALAIYDERVFQPHDTQTPAEEEPAPDGQASTRPERFTGRSR